MILMASVQIAMGLSRSLQLVFLVSDLMIYSLLRFKCEPLLLID